jgi:gliding motility-associated-like protein
VVNPSSFVASFSGVVNGSNTSFTVLVTVHAKPVAGFAITQPSSSCVVKTVTLTDQSTSSSSIATRLWTYGDGGSGTQSGTHTYGYTLPGTYSVTLKVTDIHGCDNQLTIGTISVTTPPTAAISSNPSNLFSCQSTFSAAFSASNSTGSNMSYNWNFGNGQTSNQMNAGPVTFTQQPSPYNVLLVVTANGCTAAASAVVAVSTPTMSAAVPATACANAAPIATVNSNLGFTTWNMGNGNVSMVVTPIPSDPTVAIPAYTTTGLYTITVNAGSGQCSLTPLTFTISVQQVTASYATSQGIICNPPVVMTFTNNSSSNATQFFWSYIDPVSGTHTSSATNATFTFNALSTDPYAFNYVSYSPSVTLVATSPAGCSATLTSSSHSMQPPTAWFFKNKREGCNPLNVTFYDSSYAFPSNPITSYTWNNGGSPPVTALGTGTPIPPQLFTYTANGVYRPFLVVQTALGCRDTSFIDTVIVASPPAVNFSFFPSTVCPNQTVQIVNTTPGSVTIQHWHADSDAGYFSGCVSNGNPTWLFTHVGVHTFTLSGYQNGCKGTAVSGQSVTVLGPIARTRYETSCTNRKSVVFQTHLQNVQTATLNFGDNSSTVITGNATGIVSHSVTHAYANTGDYTATVTGVNVLTGCAPSVFSVKVRVRDAAASFTVPPVLCAGSTTSLTASSSTDVVTGCGRGYVWSFDGNAPQESSSPITAAGFNGAGVHSVTLLVKDLNSCTSTLTRTLAISDFTPAFALSANTICVNGTVQITNQTPNQPDSVVAYDWSFGNGQILSTTDYTVPVQSYTLSSVPAIMYSIVMTATNSKGCVRTTGKVLQVNLPDAGFNASPTGCIPPNTPTNITFIATTSHPSYTIHYGSATASLITSSQITTHTFMPGVYTITMSVKDVIGCTNTHTKTINPTQVPVANFTFSSPGSQGGNSICSPNIVSFTNITSPVLYTPSWTIGSSPVLPLNVVAFPFSASTTSVVVISMSVNSGAPYFCGSSVTKNFTVYVANADIVASKTLMCLGDEVKFNVDTTGGGGVKAWVWDFGDATSTATLVAGVAPPGSVAHKYTDYAATAAGNMTASLIYYSAAYACKYAAEKPLKMIRITGGFDRNKELVTADSVHCFKLTDALKGFSEVNHASNITYNWQIAGTASSGSLQNVILPNPGVHSISLTLVESANNCSYTAVKNITINPLPTATIVSSEYCPNRPFTISVTAMPGVVSGTWAPPSGIIGAPVFTTDTVDIRSTGINSVTTDYTLQVTNSSSCVSEPIVEELRIMLPPPLVVWDTAVVIGEPVPINAWVGVYDYTWTPQTSDLSCTLCPNPVSTSTNSIEYLVIVEDSLRCSKTTNTYRIEILPKSSVDVPQSFTPNGDGRNDMIYVDGWGIRKLNYFRIYNRWGQLIFESNDINVGWDGTYNGVRQNIETYVYQVSVETYIDDKPLVKSSTFRLLR